MLNEKTDIIFLRSPLSRAHNSLGKSSRCSLFLGQKTTARNRVDQYKNPICKTPFLFPHHRWPCPFPLLFAIRWYWWTKLDSIWRNAAAKADVALWLPASCGRAAAAAAAAACWSLTLPVNICHIFPLDGGGGGGGCCCGSPWAEFPVTLDLVSLLLWFPCAKRSASVFIPSSGWAS